MHPAGELPGAEAGMPREVAHRERLVEAGSRPLERRREPIGVARLGRWGDELHLPAAAVGGHDQSPRDPVAGGGTEVTAHEVDAEIEGRRLAGRGEHVALVDVEHVGAHVDLRIAAGQLVGMHPVRGRDASVEEPGRRQHERTGAQRRDPHTALVRHAQRVDEPRVRLRVEVDGGRHDDRVDMGELVVRRRRLVRQPGVGGAVGRADHEVVPLPARRQVRAVHAKDLRGDRGFVEHR